MGERKVNAINFDQKLPSSHLDELIVEAVADSRDESFQPYNFILPSNDVSLRERIVDSLQTAGQPVSGISFYSLRQFAKQLLAARGIAVSSEPLIRRQLALEGIIHADLPALEYFDDSEQLREAAGYAASFNSNIRASEAAGLGPEKLNQIDSTRVRDLAALWSRADSSLGWSGREESGTVSPGRELHRFLRESEAGNITIPGRFQNGLCLVEDLQPVEADFLEVISRENFILLKLTSPLAGKALPRTETEDDQTAICQLKSRLFRSDSYETTPGVERDDDSVRFEEYSVPEREDEAAVQWLLNRLECGESPRELGVVFADRERIGSLYSYIRNCERRLSDCCGEKVDIPLYVPEGLKLSEVPGGTRFFALVRALRSFLRQDEMLTLLPLLRFDDDQVYNASSQLWKKWICDNGMVGGSPARPGEAENWLDDLQAAMDSAQSKLEAQRSGDAGPHTGSIEQLELRFEIMELACEPLEQLIEICRLIETEEAGLRELWGEISAFADRWLNTKQDGRDLLEIIDESIGDQLPPASDRITGDLALRIIFSLLREEKFPFLESDPDGVFLGTFQTARFRSFESLRFLGLNENSLPAIPREDPVLPDSLRHKINDRFFENEKSGLPDSEQNARRRLRSFYHLIQSVRTQAVFTSTRRDSDQTRRAPSSLFVDLALASGKSGQQIPGDDWIKSEMKRGRRRAAEASYPLAPRRQADTDDSIEAPAGWQEENDSSTQLSRIAELTRGLESEFELVNLDGIFGKNIPDFCLRGLTEDWPLSAGAAGTFISCPHQFLLNRVLGLSEPEEPSPTTQLSALQFGSLLHETVEEIYEEISEAGEFSGDLLERAKSTGEALFDRKISSFGLIGEDTIQREKERFLNAVENLIKIDSERHRLQRRFELERRFGFDNPVKSAAGLYIRGIIDRVEHIADGRVALRDLKSGKPRADEEFLPDYDIQLGVYRRGILAVEDGPEQVEELSFIYPSQPWNAERLFATDDNEQLASVGELAEQTENWLTLVKDFLVRGLFPRSESSDDCTYCPFKPVCGSKARKKLKGKLDQVEPGWADRFLARKEES